MRLSLDADTTRNTIHAYGQGCIRVNEREIHRSVIVTPETIIDDWPPQTFAALEEIHFELIEKLEPEIVLLGTGNRQHFPHPLLTRRLLIAGIGVEVMDTAAACRTYNVIMSEGRRVAAALLMI